MVKSKFIEALGYDVVEQKNERNSELLLFENGQFVDKIRYLESPLVTRFFISRDERDYELSVSIDKFPDITVDNFRGDYLHLRYNDEMLLMKIKNRIEYNDISETIFIKYIRNKQKEIIAKKFIYKVKLKKPDFNYKIAYSIEFEHRIGTNETTITQREDEYILSEQQVKSTLFHAIRKFDMPINAFHSFRRQLNNIIPAKNEILSSFLKDCDFPLEELNVFIPDIIEARKSKIRTLK